MKPQERIRTALQKAQLIIARYIHPGQRNCADTVNDLAEVFDDEKVVRAMKEIEEATPPAERASPIKARESSKRVAKTAYASSDID